MRVRRYMLGVTAALCVGATANATIIIPTNLGKGADAELREFEGNVDLFTSVAKGGNRGGSTELATRKDDKVAVDTTTDPDTITNYFPTNDRSSVMLLKFDVGSLPAAADPFWNNKQVGLRLHVRQSNNITGQRLWNVVPGGNSTNVADYRLMNFGIRGLEPGATYVDDNPLAANRTDRVGNPWVASQYKYDWTEGTGNSGTDTSGVTFYNAPGITPHCSIEGSCLDANIPNSNATSIFQTLGKHDDFDSNTRVIDNTWHWPNEQAAAGFTSTTTLPANLTGGTPIDYLDPNGSLKQLLLDAKTAGRDTITLMVFHNLDGTQNQANVGITGTTPASFLAQNYLVVPQELLTLPSGTVTNNSTGALSPQLRIFVPEPASAALVALGLLAALGFARRRK